jgi:Protein of unknown function (DUF3613)
MKRRVGAIASLFAGLLPALAITAAEAPDASGHPDHEIPLGNRTRAYLERQRSGEEASSEEHGLTPPAERRARKRYLQSFEHPIPALFEMKEEKGH